MTRIRRNFLLFAFFGTAMSFFGNLYEAVAIAPNMLENTLERLQAWQKFSAVTNPVYFYVPLTQLAIVVLIVLYFVTRDRFLKQPLKAAVLCVFPVLILTGYSVARLNFRLFFGDLSFHPDQLPSLAWQWTVLNGIRVILLGIALRYIFRAVLRTYTQKG